MSILINKNTKLIVQGITGNQGAFHTKLMQDYGTNIVAGVTPGKEGEKVEGIPVYDSVKNALNNHEADISIIFVPAKFAHSAAMEALENGLNIVVISEHIPVLDVIKIANEAEKRNLTMIGPNCPGIITPKECKIGIMPGEIFTKGDIGVISRSGTLTYEIIDLLSKNEFGQSTVVGIGGDSVVGSSFLDILGKFEEDPDTSKIILIGEIGGDNEEKAADYIKENISKPVFAYIAGKTAPEGKTMGHAGAIISGNSGTYKSKVEKLEKAGVKIAKRPSELIELISS